MLSCTFLITFIFILTRLSSLDNLLEIDGANFDKISRFCTHTFKREYKKPPFVLPIDFGDDVGYIGFLAIKEITNKNVTFVSDNYKVMGWFQFLIVDRDFL